MENIIDQNEILEKVNKKLEKMAFRSILFVILFLTYKFTIYFIHSIQIDSVLIPNYVHTFPFKASFASGLFLCITLIVTFYLYKIKKYQLVIMLNAIFITQGIAFPYILHIANNY